jgi:uncharacterized protein (TIGR03435 family)
MPRVICLTCLALLLGCAFAQTAPPPAFDVASVKPADLQGYIGISNYPGGRISANNYTLEMLISEAFHLPLAQISGGPAWVRTEKYAIEAKPPASLAASKLIPASTRTPLSAEQCAMLQGLLAERFHLKFHHESKEGIVYLLVKGQAPLKLLAPKDPDSIAWVGNADSGPIIGAVGIAGINISMSELAYHLTFSPAMIGRPVFDRTGIEGSFDFKFKPAAQSGAVGPSVNAGMAAPSSDPGGGDDARSRLRYSITEALNGIGLGLVQGKGPVETIVIDHAEKPSKD